jgi:hypothetical protein
MYWGLSMEMEDVERGWEVAFGYVDVLEGRW